MHLKFYLLFFLLLQINTHGVSQTPSQPYIEINCDRSDLSIEQENIRRTLLSLKGEIKTLVQFHYVMVRDKNGTRQEKFQPYPITSYGYSFDQNRKVTAGWGYNIDSHQGRVDITNYVNFKTGLRTFDKSRMKGDTVIQTGYHGRINYYVKEEIVKSTLPDYHTRTIYSVTKDGRESRTFVNSSFQELTRFDKNRNPQYILAYRLQNGDGKILSIVEQTFQYDNNLNKMAEHVIAKDTTGATLANRTSTFEYENGLLTKISPSLFNEYYKYDSLGNIIASREHGIEFVHKYTYDKNSNWTQRVIYEKENDTKPLKLIAVMRRMIEYW